jgi:hypothetical protein
VNSKNNALRFQGSSTNQRQGSKTKVLNDAANSIFRFFEGR